MKNKVYHWVDQTAEKIVREKGDKLIYVLASGITPSGVIHIGNFREVITTFLVKKGLEGLGKKVRFIFSWDDYDVFRKVPVDAPQRDVLEKYLGKPIINVPDTYDNGVSYAKYHELRFENSLKKMNINPEYIYQSDEYKSSRYAQKILKALENTEIIKKELNKHRKTQLKEDWLPISIFCQKCLDNDVQMAYLGEAEVNYKCNSCSYEDTVNLFKTSIVKLLWRVDWPMRWSEEKVDFEPGGKDHSSEGGSFDTGKEIVKKVYDFEAPSYISYDFVKIKGLGGKISSSKGNVITLDDVLEIYEPSIIFWIFTSYKSNVEFSISFDIDVLKIYEDYDRVERIYFDEEIVSESKKPTIKRAYELSQIDLQEKRPIQPSFRHFCNIIQINDFDFEKVKDFYSSEIKNDFDLKKLENRFFCAVNWIKKHAPEDFKFFVLKDKTDMSNFNEKEKNILFETSSFLKKNIHVEEKDLSNFIFTTIQENGFELKDGFKIFYQCLLNKEKGPKLASLIKTIGIERVISLIN